MRKRRTPHLPHSVRRLTAFGRKTSPSVAVSLVSEATHNVLLSAVIGGRARLVLSHPHVEEVLTTETVFAEVERYAAVLGRKRKIPEETPMLAVASLPVSIGSREVYVRSMARARKRIGWRDPDDVDLLALTLQFKVSPWSNDNDFEGCEVERYTIAALLKMLGVESQG
jgi:predicted nucleic acid-binding protein